MVFKPLVWYCRPVENGIWAKETDSAFGAFTPCAIDSLVIGVSHLVLLGLCLYRIWLIQMNCRIRRFQLKSKLYNYVLLILSGYCVGEPLLRLIMGISLFNLDGQSGLAPFEVCIFPNLCLSLGISMFSPFGIKLCLWKIALSMMPILMLDIRCPLHLQFTVVFYFLNFVKLP